MKLAVPGAELYWSERGSGPTVLMLQGGDGDAEGSNAIAERSSGFRFVSFDRRGLSRSTLETPSGLELAVHTDDAAAVIAAAGGGPVFVFGTSIGALIGLDLVARYPDLVTRLIAHEPPATEFLSEEDRASSDRARDEIEATYKSAGVLQAMRKFLAATGVDFMDREDDVGLPAPNPARVANLKFFLEHDAPAARRHRVDVEALRPHREKIVLAVGAKSKGLWLHRCGAGLAAALGVELVEFPGGHGGYQSHPRGFAEKLAALFR